MRCLIVDDNKIALSLLENVLLESGYQVELAENGKAAMEKLRDSFCNLVITDLEMPEMNGIELCRAIRGADLPGYIYVILLTAHDTLEEKLVGLSAGADDFITKPFNLCELMARVGGAERVLSMETRDVTIFAMAKLAESRDQESGAHLERVRSYSRVLSQHLAVAGKHPDEINAEFIRLIYLTSPLHDIGKVGIPDSVLLKPGSLTPAEFEIMKTHASIGAQTLDAALRVFPNVKFLQMARDIAATHHERYDGTGYPAGLSDQDIPICGRIVALADVYDALTSKRVYKDAYTHELAKSIILQETGKHFDPNLVEAFIDSEFRFVEIKDSYRENRAISVEGRLPLKAA